MFPQHRHLRLKAVPIMEKAISSLKKLRKKVSLHVFMQINAKPRPFLKKARCKDLSAYLLCSRRLDKWLKK